MQVGDLVINHLEQVRLVVDIRENKWPGPHRAEVLLMGSNGEKYWAVEDWIMKINTVQNGQEKMADFVK